MKIGRACANEPKIIKTDTEALTKKFYREITKQKVRSRTTTNITRKKSCTKILHKKSGTKNLAQKIWHKKSGTEISCRKYLHTPALDNIIQRRRKREIASRGRRQFDALSAVRRQSGGGSGGRGGGSRGVFVIDQETLKSRGHERGREEHNRQGEEYIHRQGEKTRLRFERRHP
jgi:hypothetical protein